MRLGEASGAVSKIRGAIRRNWMSQKQQLVREADDGLVTGIIVELGAERVGRDAGTTPLGGRAGVDRSAADHALPPYWGGR
jgi:hypothetical protein